MQKATKVVLGLAAVSAVLALASFWWWTRLLAETFAECVATPVPPPGLDCSHEPQFFAGMAFTIICLGLLLSLLVRAVRSRRRRPS